MQHRELQDVSTDWINHEFPGETSHLRNVRSEIIRLHLEHYVSVLELVPQSAQRGRLLELGAGTYLMTFLLRHFRNYDLELVQYWGMPNGAYESVLIDQRTGRRMLLPFQQFNAESDIFPYPNASFDVVLCCWMIEHLLYDPVHLLTECHRVLKPKGRLVLTTPNVLCLWHVISLMRGRNVYHKYSQVSPYERHAREYTPEEVRRLCEAVGFGVTHLRTRNAKHKMNRSLARILIWLCIGITDVACRMRGHRGNSLLRWRGEQIFLAAERAETAHSIYPGFLFAAPDIEQPLLTALCRPRMTVEP